MKKTFVENVAHEAAKNSKKHKLFAPLFFFLAAILIGIYKLLVYLRRNSKKYITMCLFCVFFFMSSSFAFPKDNSDDSIYLVSNEGSYIEDAEIPHSDSFEDVSEVNVDKIEWIEDTDLKYDVLVENLTSNTEADLFDIDDFMNVNPSPSDTADDSAENFNDYSVSGNDSGFNAKSGNGSEIVSNSFDMNSWNLLLVNKTHPIPEEYEVPLTTISGSMQCDERVLTPLLDMMSAAQKEGISIIVTSPYRDYELQSILFQRRIDAYIEKGYSYMQAYKASSQKVTVPGASEHQLGLAFDLVTSGHTSLDWDFENTDAGKWLIANSADYGFILRYPRGSEYVTGIEYEPWHYRYVGVEAAQYIKENNITLEEFKEIFR